MPQCAVITCGFTYRKVPYVRYHRFPYQAALREIWKDVCGRKDTNYNCETGRVCSIHFSRDNYEKDLEHELLGLPPRTRLRRGAIPDLEIPSKMPNLKMKQNVKKKLNVKKNDVKQQNGHQVKKPTPKKKATKKLVNNIDDNLNVNGRPVRKKKKSKKYSFFEKDGRSTTPEIAAHEETNLLLALGLTPIKTQQESLNRMHIMEEENAKMTLGETPSESPKTSIVAATTTTSEVIIDKIKEESPASPKVNGICVKNSEEDEVVEVDSRIKEETICNSRGLEIVRVPSSTNSEIDVKVEVKEEKEAPVVESSREIIPEPQDLTVTCTSSFEAVPKSVPNVKQNKVNHKVISISVEQCQNRTEQNGEESDRVKAKPITNRKRSSKSTDSDEPSVTFKKQKFPEIDRLNDEREQAVNEYVEKATGSTLEELQKNTDKLQQEIHSLSALARAKEVEWNHIIRLKKIKEEMFLRLVRRKQIALLMMGAATGRVPDGSDWDTTPDHFFLNDELTYNHLDSTSSKPPPKIPSNLTITKSQSNPSQNLQRFLMQPQNQNQEPKPNQPLMMVPIVSSSPLLISSSSKIQNSRPHNLSTLRIPMPDRDKFRNNPSSSRNNLVPILPKPNPNPNSNEHSPPIGRQGPIVDVKSIIADYRQAHPEQIPRRGRRLKGGPPNLNFSDNLVSSSRNILSMSSLALGSGSQVRTVNSTSGSDYPFMMASQSQDTSRPSSTDSNRSNTNVQSDNLTASGLSFKDVLVQFAKMSQNQQGDRKNGTPPSTQGKPPIYPEVTLHPVLPSGSQSPPNPSSSLLHGILTKSSTTKTEATSSSRATTFSPTLARLLTTPERPPTISTTITTTAMRGGNTSSSSSSIARGAVSISDILSSSKNRNELTITPVVSQPAKVKEDTQASQDDDPDDSADRLIIDESEDQENRDEDEIDAENVPQCQGCHMKSAQFVCAGCGNQWYCSRNCQVTAWDEHSEVCSG